MPANRHSEGESGPRSAFRPSRERNIPVDLAKASADAFRLSVLQRLKDQDWRCAYACEGDHGGKLIPGEPIALAYDGVGLVHLECARYSTVPAEGNPWQSQI